MAVGLRLSFYGGTAEQYDSLHDHMGIDGDPPAGMIFHSAGPADDHWVVADVWESREAFNAFGQSRLQPALQELGDRALPGPPEIVEFPVHRYTIGKS